MTGGVTRATTAGRVFNDLRNLARRQGRGTDELLVLYILERWLFRASRSPYRDRLILKGGLLLAALDAPPETPICGPSSTGTRRPWSRVSARSRGSSLTTA